MIESETRTPGAPMKVYTLDKLLDELEATQHPAIRRVIGQMIYTLGQRDQIATSMGNEFGVKL